MRAAIGLFAALAVLGGAASAESPGIKTAGLFTPLPAASNEGLLWRVVKITCSCKNSAKPATKSIVVEGDYCPQGMKPSCDCYATPPAAICAKARN
jgi:hypothetical protein